MKTIQSLLAVCLLSWSALAVPTLAAEWKLVYRRGEPIADHGRGWDGHVDRASWVDDDRIVCGTSGKVIQCVSTSKDKVVWSIKTPSDLRDWSLCRKTRRLAFLERQKGERLDQQLTVVNCDDGTKPFTASGDRLAELLGLEYVIPCGLAFSPDDGSLFLCDYASAYGKHGYVLGPTYDKVTSRFSIDASPQEISFSPDGKRLAVIADKEVLCVHDWGAGSDIFLLGTRIVKERSSISGVIDAPFFSHIRHDGAKTVICTQDNSWSTGEVQVHDLGTKKTKTFDAANGHIEMDVDFKRRRIVLTGTEAGLLLTDFDGKELANLKQATLQRNVSVEFSPSGDRVLVGSWDNTVSVFELVD